jgi:integrase
MSVRKRTWISGGEIKSGWQADYLDAKGKRRRKMFARKKDADAYALTAAVEVRDGVHVADADTVTVEQAGRLWIKTGEAAGLERGTLDQRRQHLDLHIVPLIGAVRLNKTSVPWVRSFQDKLRETGRSPAMVKRVTVSLGSIIGDAQDRGLVVRNPVHERSRSRSVAKSREARAKVRLVVGVDIPLPEEVRALVSHLEGRWRPLLLTAVFTGMRSSELRGLTWANVDLERGLVHVRQRADAYNVVGRPKSEAGNRSIPVPPIVANTLREWKLACPRRNAGTRENPMMVLDLVFPTGAGNIETRGNIARRGLIPSMIAAGITVDTGKRDEEGNPVVAAKYTGMHALRHFYASWCINPASVGGQGLSPKVVQERMGHSTIGMTMDTYGHLFPAEDHADLLARASALLLG